MYMHQVCSNSSNFIHLLQHQTLCIATRRPEPGHADVRYQQEVWRAEASACDDDERQPSDVRLHYQAVALLRECTGS